MSSGNTPSLFKILAVSLTLIMALKGGSVFAAAVSGGSAFDIPISELNKVKKKPATHRATGESKSKRKKVAKVEEASSKSTEPGAPTVQPEAPLAESAKSPVNSAPRSDSSESGKPAAKPDDTVIHHFPYSFVVPGKRTVIHAVINSKAEIKDVNCTLRSAESGTKIQVKMEKASGSNFTYKAELPAVTSGNSLRYFIQVVDSQGVNTRSQEFVIPVTPSPVVPSWQLENVSEVIQPLPPAVEKKPESLPAPAVTR